MILARLACFATFSSLVWACSSTAGTSSGAASDAAAFDAGDAAVDTGSVEVTTPMPSTFLSVCQVIQKVDLRGMLHMYGEAVYGPIDPKIGRSTEMTLTLYPLKLGTNTLDPSVRVGQPIVFPKGPLSLDGTYHESVNDVTIDKQAAATNVPVTFTKFDTRFFNRGGNFDICLNVTSGSSPPEVIKCVTIQATAADTYTGTHDTVSVGSLSGAIVFDGKPCQ